MYRKQTVVRPSVTPKGVIGVVNKDNSRGEVERGRGRPLPFGVTPARCREREFGLGRKGRRWVGGEKEVDK